MYDDYNDMDDYLDDLDDDLEDDDLDDDFDFDFEESLALSAVPSPGLPPIIS